jgi:hypothetical protein
VRGLFGWVGQEGKSSGGESLLAPVRGAIVLLGSEIFLVTSNPSARP